MFRKYARQGDKKYSGFFLTEGIEAKLIFQPVKSFNEIIATSSQLKTITDTVFEVHTNFILSSATL